PRPPPPPPFPYTTLFRSAGDDVLREAAARLRRVTRPADVVARFSADEFLVLLADIEPTSGTAGDDAHQRDSAQVSQAIAGQIRRSEEHTSELQSRSDLVC